LNVLEPAHLVSIEDAMQQMGDQFRKTIVEREWGVDPIAHLLQGLQASQEYNILLWRELDGGATQFIIRTTLEQFMELLGTVLVQCVPCC